MAKTPFYSILNSTKTQIVNGHPFFDSVVSVLVFFYLYIHTIRTLHQLTCVLW